MANGPFLKNSTARLRTTAANLPDVTPGGANKTPGTGASGGLASKLGGALGYKGSRGKGWPMPSPGLHGMGGHAPGLSDGMARSSELRGIGVQALRLGSFSGPKGVTAPRGSVGRHRGGMVGGSGSGGGDSSLSAGRAVPARPGAGFAGPRSPFGR